MKDKKKVAKLIEALKAEIETPYELAAIERLDNELKNGKPKIEDIDENHKKFLGMTFHKIKSGHFSYTMGLHQAVWIYHFGNICDGYVIHHKDVKPENNDIENLQAVTKNDHINIHNELDVKNFICVNCGKEYKAIDRKTNQFCSRKCSREYFKRKHEIIRVCAYCGKEFSSKFRQYKYADFCSKSCAAKAIIENKKTNGDKIIAICKNCGAEYEKKNNRQKFCSKKCESDANDKRICICEFCGKEFLSKNWRNQRCCSRICANKAKWAKRKAEAGVNNM